MSDDIFRNAAITTILNEFQFRGECAICHQKRAMDFNVGICDECLRRIEAQ